MEKMTIHRALAELKLIDAKIQKSISTITPSGVMQADKLVNNLYPKEVFEADTKAKFQSITDLIERKFKIKSAIVKANSITPVQVAGKVMTISEAINFKTIIEAKKNLAETINHKHTAIKANFIRENEKINSIALENAKIMIGRPSDDKIKPNDNDVKAIIEPFIKRNEWIMVDPLNAEETYVKLSDEVSSFETEVDAVLSEINATTFIEI